jgi:hypothetical protein
MIRKTLHISRNLMKIGRSSSRRRLREAKCLTSSLSQLVSVNQGKTLKILQTRFGKVARRTKSKKDEDIQNFN